MAKAHTPKPSNYEQISRTPRPEADLPLAPGLQRARSITIGAVLFNTPMPEGTSQVFGQRLDLFWSPDQIADEMRGDVVLAVDVPDADGRAGGYRD